MLAEAVKWAVPVVLSAALAVAIKQRKAIRAWNRRRIERKRAFREMVTGFSGLAAKVGKISSQVHPNGGGSLMDAVARTEGEVSTLRKDVAGVRQSVAAVEVMVRAASDLATEGEFECDATGSISSANLYFARIVGVGRKELEQHGWKNFLHPDDAPEFLQKADIAFAENRTFSGKLRIVRPTDGTEVRVDIVVMPFPDTPPSRWFGKVRMLQ